MGVGVRCETLRNMSSFSSRISWARINYSVLHFLQHFSQVTDVCLLSNILRMWIVDKKVSDTRIQIFMLSNAVEKTRTTVLSQIRKLGCKEPHNFWEQVTASLKWFHHLKEERLTHLFEEIAHSKSSFKNDSRCHSCTKTRRHPVEL